MATALDCLICACTEFLAENHCLDHFLQELYINMQLAYPTAIESPSTPWQVPQTSSGQSLRLLFIEDEPDIQATVQLALESFSSFIVGTTDHQNALALTRYQNWDLFLLEVATAEGIDLTTYYQIKENTKNQHIPVILLTSRVMPEEIARLQQLDIAGIIPKPFNPVDLGRNITALL
jgi:CheY-like chemotaxis protein